VGSWGQVLGGQVSIDAVVRWASETARVSANSKTKKKKKNTTNPKTTPHRSKESGRSSTSEKNTTLARGKLRISQEENKERTKARIQGKW